MLGEVIKQIAGSAANTQPPCTFIFGTVVSTEPLSVQVDNRFFVGESALVLLKPSVSGSFCSHTHKQPSNNLAPMELAGQVYTRTALPTGSIAPYRLVNRCSDFISIWRAC